MRPAHEIATPAYRDELAEMLPRAPGSSVLAVGSGRSYGDCCLNRGGSLIDMTRLDRLIAFDAGAGTVEAEAGLTIGALLGVIVPKGWFLATTPGTRFVTLGGAVANDVHGKNHHGAGSIGCSLSQLELLRSDGRHHTLDAADPSDLLRATIGGLGLTGAITSVRLQLAPIKSAFLEVDRVAFGNIAEFFPLASGAGAFEHTVAWIDCAAGGADLGRGIFQRGRWLDDGGVAGVGRCALG